jgi:hypothetical protein
MLPDGNRNMNNLRIINSIPLSDTLWLEFCKKCHDATFFHTPHWANLFVDRYPWRFNKATYMLTFDDTTEVLVPLVKKRHLFGAVSVACSMPAATYGGPLSLGVLDREHGEATIRSLRRFPDLILRENPYQPMHYLADGASCIDDVTQTIDLTQGYDAIWKNAAYSHRKAVRNAIKNSIEIVEAQQHSEWEQYLSLYTASIDRWKERNIFSGVRYDQRFFLTIEKMEPSLRRLWLAKVHNTIIAGIICFYWNTHVVAWHGAALSDYFSMYPNNLLYDRVCHDALQKGYRWFDCNPCANLSGVYKFKQYLGAQPIKSRILIQRSSTTQFFDSLRKRFRIK